MESNTYFMPTKVIYGIGCIEKNKVLFEGIGKKAFIVTGKSSEENGSLNDVLAVLKNAGIQYSVYNETEENPSVECVYGASLKGINENCDFVIGIGGGSPLDAAKSIAVLMKNKELKGEDLYNTEIYSALPVIAVPTTAGTGSEVTPYSILTDHNLGTKSSTPQKVFPIFAFLDGSYLAGMPNNIMVNTVIDALCHLIESYMSTSSTYISDRLCESAIESFGKIKSCLLDKHFTADINNELILISAMGGMAISQTGTSLPHYLGYRLTYNNSIPHGKACGILLYEYLSSFNDTNKVGIITKKLGFNCLIEFKNYLRCVLEQNEQFSANDIESFVNFAMKRPAKLNSYPNGADKALVKQIYVNSLLL